MKKALSAVLISLAFAQTAHAATQTATLAGGCFWGMQEYFRHIPGVLSTQVGYAGANSSQTPNYEEVSSARTPFAESVEIKFDDSKVSYQTLLYHFFKMHDPTTLNRQGNDAGPQYRSAVFYNTPLQKTAAESVIAQITRSNAWKAPLTTQVAPTEHFYAAEDYHQDYLVKHPGGYDNHYVRNLKF